MIGSLIGNIIGGGQQQGGYSNASNYISGGVGQGVGALTNAYNTSQSTLQPYSGIGLTQLNSLLNSGYLTNQFNNTDLNANLAPNYSFMLGQGQTANRQQNNLTGGVNSGNADVALQNYTQGYAQNAYQDAFNNYQNQRNSIFKNLSPIATMGQSGTNALATGQTAYGNSLANLYTGQGTALAGNAIGAGNAASNNTQAIGGITGGILNNVASGSSSLGDMLGNIGSFFLG